MDTSRSPEAQWTASVDIFSGRRNPTWTLPPALGRDMEHLWARLPGWTGEPVPEPPPLGYRGCILCAPDGRRWFAFAGMVSAGADVRSDAGRTFERTIVESAPSGTLPSIAF